VVSTTIATDTAQSLSANILYLLGRATIEFGAFYTLTSFRKGTIAIYLALEVGERIGAGAGRRA
jgi:hypothetical protein